MVDYDVVVIGGGAGGLTSAMYSARGGLKTVIIERGLYGGQLQNTGDIENYSGFGKITGAELSNHMYQQAVEQGVGYVYGDVEAVIPSHELSEQKSFLILFSGGKKPITAKAVIIATGVQHRHLGVDGEEEFAGRGVSYCAICDGAFFKDGHVAVVGGGDSALEEANYLTGLVDKVTLIHRRDTFRGQKVLQDRVFNNPKIEIRFNSRVASILGENGRVEKLHLVSADGKLHSYPKVDGIFIYVGLDPISEPFKPLGIVNERGYIETDDNMQTSIEGIFAVGDVREKIVRQISTAVGDGAIAGTKVRDYIDGLED